MHGLEDFYDAFGIVAYFVRILRKPRNTAMADFVDYLVLFLVTPVYSNSFIIPVVTGTVDVDVCIDSDVG